MKAVMYNYSNWLNYDIDKENESIDELEKLVLESGFNIVKKVDYHFPKQGYTALWLLSESHFAVHTFPEECRMYIEMSSCVKEYFDNFIQLIQQLDVF